MISTQANEIIVATITSGQLAYSLGLDTMIVHWFHGSREGLPDILALADRHQRTRVLWVIERKSFIPVLLQVSEILAGWERPKVIATVFEISKSPGEGPYV